MRTSQLCGYCMELIEPINRWCGGPHVLIPHSRVAAQYCVTNNYSHGRATHQTARLGGL